MKIYPLKMKICPLKTAQSVALTLQQHELLSIDWGASGRAEVLQIPAGAEQRPWRRWGVLCCFYTV